MAAEMGDDDSRAVVVWMERLQASVEKRLAMHAPASSSTSGSSRGASTTSFRSKASTFWDMVDSGIVTTSVSTARERKGTATRNPVDLLPDLIRAVRSNLSSKTAWLQLSAGLAMCNLVTENIFALERANRLDPLDEHTAVDCAQALISAKRHTDAVDVLVRCLGPIWEEGKTKTEAEKLLLEVLQRLGSPAAKLIQQQIAQLESERERRRIAAAARTSVRVREQSEGAAAIAIRLADTEFSVRGPGSAFFDPGMPSMERRRRLTTASTEVYICTQRHVQSMWRGEMHGMPVPILPSVVPSSPSWCPREALHYPLRTDSHII